MENKTLKTMEEKMNQDPNEMMENGLTRAQNEKIEKDGEAFGGLISLIGGGIAIWVVLQSLSNF
jgi:hypothetical protein